MDQQPMAPRTPAMTVMVVVDAGNGGRPGWSVAPATEPGANLGEPLVAAINGVFPMTIIGELDYLTSWAAELTRTLRRYGAELEPEPEPEPEPESTDGTNETDRDDRDDRARDRAEVRIFRDAVAEESAAGEHRAPAGDARRPR